MKRILVALVGASASLALMQAPAFATPEPIHSNLTCVITMGAHNVKWSAVRDMTRINKPLMYTASDIKCPGNLNFSKDSFMGKHDPYVLENGEWGIVQKEWPNGYNGGVQQIVTISRKSWDVDPYTGLATGMGMMMSSGTWEFRSDQVPDAMVINDYLSLGTWNVENQSIYSWGYLVYKNNDLVTRYKIKFASDIDVKFESTVSVSAKKHGKSLTITALTSRNRPSSLAFFSGKLVKAYRNDKATLYRDGKKIRVKKISRNGKVLFNVKKTKKPHVYEVRIPSNVVNFAGSGTVTK